MSDSLNELAQNLMSGFMSEVQYFILLSFKAGYSVCNMNTRASRMGRQRTT